MIASRLDNVPSARNSNNFDIHTFFTFAPCSPIAIAAEPDMTADAAKTERINLIRCHLVGNLCGG